jgi:hypothetical protein
MPWAAGRFRRFAGRWSTPASTLGVRMCRPWHRRTGTALQTHGCPCRMRRWGAGCSRRPRRTTLSAPHPLCPGAVSEYARSIELSSVRRSLSRSCPVRSPRDALENGRIDTNRRARGTQIGQRSRVQHQLPTFWRGQIAERWHTGSRVAAADLPEQGAVGLGLDASTEQIGCAAGALRVIAVALRAALLEDLAAAAGQLGDSASTQRGPAPPMRDPADVIARSAGRSR